MNGVKVFYHGTTPDALNEIQKEGYLFGRRYAEGKELSRCTYLTPDIQEARMYGTVLLKVKYNPFVNPSMNNYIDGCWQFRVYEPIPITNIEIINRYERSEHNNKRSEV